jgi:hypothetical protein
MKYRSTGFFHDVDIDTSDVPMFEATWECLACKQKDELIRELAEALESSKLELLRNCPVFPSEIVNHINRVLASILEELRRKG